MSTAVAVRESHTLWEIEENLQALLDTVDLVEDPKELAEIQTTIAFTLEQATQKRDQVAGWLAEQESRISLIDLEIARLQQLKERRERGVSRVEEYVISTILAHGCDSRGRYPRLDGKTSCFSVRRNPASVEVVDEDAIPEEMRSVTICFTGREWAEFEDSVDVETYAAIREHIRKRSVEKAEIKTALERGVSVPGAQIAPIKYRLVRD